MPAVVRTVVGSSRNELCATRNVSCAEESRQLVGVLGEHALPAAAGCAMSFSNAASLLRRSLDRSR